VLGLLAIGLVASAPVSGARLELVRVDHTPRTESWRYRAVVDGLPIDQAQTVVTFDLSGREVFRDSDIPAFTSVLRSTRSDSELSQLAHGAVPFALCDFGGLERVFFAVQGALHEGAWVFVPTPKETDNWHVAVDAVEGRVLAAQNRRYEAALDAQVYLPSPGGADAGVGITPTVGVQLLRLDGGTMLRPDASVTEGDVLEAFNCCLNEGCDPDAGPRFVTNYAYLPDAGYFDADGGIWNWDAGTLLLRTVVCDRVHRASNDVALHPSGDFVFPPIDGPAALAQSSAEYSDPFAEVHAFFHAHRFIEWVEGVSGGSFQLRDNRRAPSVPLLVQTNHVEPDTVSDPTGACLLFGLCTWTRFGSVGNAMFVPREQYAHTQLPPLYPDRDGVYFFQGPLLDFAYDATVVRHELGHAVVQSTAALRFGQPRVESTWASDERGALHEGLADFLAAASANDPDIGPYLGPNRDRTGDGPLRSTTNSIACPAGLEGTIHEDGRIIAGALWDARTLLPAGHLDAAVYAALLALSPSANFDTTAEAVLAMVQLEDATAAATLRQQFIARGLLGCTHERVATDGGFTAAWFGLASPPLDALSRFGAMPGPYQVRFDVPARGGTFVVTAVDPPYGVQVDLRVGAPVTFAATANGLAPTSDAQAPLGKQGAYVPIPCGAPQPVYLALSSRVPYPIRLESLSLTWVPDERCPEPPVVLARLSAEWPAAKCGCTESSGLFSMLAALVLRSARRRRH
jgi:hypothetical protein